MTHVETRYPCPVCLGATLEKTTIDVPSSFVLDHCVRCGGAWFDKGEVHKLRTGTPEHLWKQIARREGLHAMQCHSCSQLLERTNGMCPACGWTVALDCPICLRPMETAEHAGLTLDACRHCMGVWVDHHELLDLWKLEFSAALTRRTGMTEGAAWVIADAVTDPFLLYYGANAAGHALSAGVHATPEIIGAAGDAAGSVFEAIAEFIAGFFG